MIKISKPGKRYGDTVVVDGVSLDIPAGGLTAIIGPNGAGKSTVLSMVSRLLPASSGSVLVDGIDVMHGDTKALAKPRSPCTGWAATVSGPTIVDCLPLPSAPPPGGPGRLSGDRHPGGLFVGCIVSAVRYGDFFGFYLGLCWLVTFLW